MITQEDLKRYAKLEKAAAEYKELREKIIEELELGWMPKKGKLGIEWGRHIVRSVKWRNIVKRLKGEEYCKKQMKKASESYRYTIKVFRKAKV